MCSDKRNIRYRQLKITVVENERGITHINKVLSVLPFGDITEKKIIFFNKDVFTLISF